MDRLFRRILSFVGMVVLVGGMLPTGATVQAQNGNPSSVTLVGNLQLEIGCGENWKPDCVDSHLSYDGEDDVWQGSWILPAQNFEYKVAINDGWGENYGRFALPGGDNIPLTGTNNSIRFYYDHKTHWITDSINSVIATVPGNFQSELGCSSDWDPSCLRSWLQDIDGDGIYTFETKAIPMGNYAAKVAINESWDVNYGQGGTPGGDNLPFSVTAPDQTVKFRYDSSSHILSILAGFQLDNDIAWDGLRHDSRDLLYRTPGGVVPAGTPVKLRLRTFHGDVSGVTARIYSVNDSAQTMLPMSIAASDVSCYQAGFEAFSCDFWEVSLDYPDPDNLWYRFIVTDGTDTDYYADNTPALDGGLGAVTEDVVDQSYALMFYDPDFTAPAWSKDAFIYQIFPDRFRNGRSNNDAETGDVRYDDPVIALDWGVLPEGYCRNYADGVTNCPWRFDATPPDSSPTKEQPRGRDYYGGDLKGVTQYLDYLKSLGVNTLYFNPIFDAGSNHSYDTQDYYRIDPYFGTQKDWENLVKGARQRGMRIVLDGVFNHLSSDSPFFDRYGHYETVGACESLDSIYRDWFYFHDVAAGMGTCVGSAGPNSATYDGWFSFDSIPVINKSLPEVQQYFLTGQNSVSKYWLEQGASAWRMDVMGDASFPAGYWETFREVVKDTKGDALIISETWQKDSTLLRMLRGDRADTTMNYRLRDAMIGLLAPGSFDSKGFADSGRVISPTEFASRVMSIREDYPDAAYYSLMNLLDSHDTERLLWTLTPGPETTDNKELNEGNLNEGKRRLQIASLIQFAMPGAPTVFYGDEVGLTGDDDPDDRRTYPWADKGGSPDTELFAHYKALSALRSQNAALTVGDLRILLADDATQVVAFGRKTTNQAAVIIINRGDQPQAGPIPVAGYLPDGITLHSAYAVGTGSLTSATVSDGQVEGTIGAKSAVILLTGQVDLMRPLAPTGLTLVSEGDTTVSLSWNEPSGAFGYNVYRSPVSGGGYVKANTSPVSGNSFTDTGLRNAQTVYYVVRGLDNSGNESDDSNEIVALPHLTIGWSNLQWPPSMNHVISAVNRTEFAYGQVWIDGVTNLTGPTSSLVAQLGYGPDGSDPASSVEWTWVDAVFNTDVGNNDEFMASLLPESTGVFDYAFRYSTTDGRDWLFADLDGTGNGYNPNQAGNLTVIPDADTIAPTVPTGLNVLSASPAGVSLAWEAITGDATLYGYEVLRSGSPGGPYVMVARVTDAAYIDTGVTEGATYFYVVRAVDNAFNRSANSNEVEATAELRIVGVVFTVSVPATTDATGRQVYIAGTLNRLDAALPDWNPGGVVLTRVDATTWTVTLTGPEATQIEYKYALGDWDHVEKDASCSEINNRMLTLSYGESGTQAVNDVVPNWRNVAPCGN